MQHKVAKWRYFYLMIALQNFQNKSSLERPGVDDGTARNGGRGSLGRCK